MSYKRVKLRYDKICKQSNISGADEWLLNNYYLVEEAYEDIKSVKIPKRAMGIAENLKIESMITEEWLISNIGENGLWDSEIWNLPAALKCKAINDIAIETSGHRMGILINSLKSLSQINMTKVFEQISGVEKILQQDPSGVYANMTEKSRDYYRKKVEEIAKIKNMTPFAVAKKARDLARKSKGRKHHIGYFLIPTILGESRIRKIKFRQKLYFFCIFLLAIAIALLTKKYFVLALIPAFELAQNLTNYFSSKLIKPEFLPRLDGDKLQLPNSYVVIPAYIGTEDEGLELLSKLEVFHLSNAVDNLKFALLADGLKNYDLLNEKLDSLNAKYGNYFEIFTRDIAWERKRGALIEFARKIKGKAKYIITLDSDTFLPFDSAKELIGAMAHPLHNPKILNGKVAYGYAIMQPRIENSIESANQTFFSKTLSGQGGVDSYSSDASDVYQDLFLEASFCGKGIIDVDCFLEVCEKNIPENQVLSHDLVEGIFLRCGLLGDITFIDSSPSSYIPWAKRLSRWIRGDWQNVFYFKSKINYISKWKIFDNLKRSLISICLLLLIALNPKNVYFVIITIGFRLFLSTITWIFSKKSKRKLHSNIIYGARGLFWQTFFQFASLPHNAWFSLVAISKAIVRTAVTKKKLLEWQTANSQGRDKSSLFGFYRFMLFNLVMAAAAFNHIYVSIIWAAAPAFLHFASRKSSKVPIAPTDEEVFMLRQLSRRIWQYFEEFANEKTHFLAPDNYQENPPNGIALRTSPTNIGLQILSTISAYDFGFISQKRLKSILGEILKSIEKLEKWNGHLYNWYELENLTPMYPRYVSSVDSGNFLAYVYVAISALQNLKENVPSFDEVNAMAENHEFWQNAKKAQKEDFANSKSCDFSEEIAMLEKLTIQTKLCKLYDESKDLFSIGFDIESQELTNSYYDILASEARQASFLAIVRREVPKKHWQRLSRSLAENHSYCGLSSWSGSCFEYLMPLLIMPNFTNTLLDETYHFAVREQINYAKQRNIRAGNNIVWGISESQFNAFDNELNYQYKAFGVPSIATSRDNLGDDAVLAPYAGVLSLMVDYPKAIENIKRLNNSGFCGTFGFYEAIDFTPSRLLKSDNYSIVKAYMAHHIGMSLLTINNILNANIMQKRFFDLPIIKSGEEMLKERVPTLVTISKKPKGEGHIRNRRQIAEDVVRENANWHLISGGKMSLVFSKFGEGTLFYKDEIIAKIKEPTGEMIFSNDRIEITNDNINLKMFISTTDKKVSLVKMYSVKAMSSFSTYNEVVLSKENDFIAHPAFCKLFVQIEGNKYIKRNRLGGEGETLVFNSCGDVMPDYVETNRARYYGRNGDMPDPIYNANYKLSEDAKIIEELVIGESDIKEWNEAKLELELARERSEIESKHLGLDTASQNLAFEWLERIYE